MTIEAPTALWLGTLPVTPNNRNQLATWIGHVTDALNGTAAIANTLVIGQASAYPTGLELLRFPNLDGDITANWGVWQRWFPTGFDRNDPMLFIGYNGHAANDRADLTEPGFFWQLESNDVAAGEEEIPLLAGGMTIIRIDGTVTRPFYMSAIKSSGVSDLSFTNRYTIFTDQSDHTLLHLAYGSSVTVGVGTACNANANFHIKGSANILWEHAAGAADNKFWDWCYSPGGLSLRAVNDAYGAAGVVFTITRSGATPTRIAFGATAVSATLADYASNAAAVSGGLAVGDLYQTSGTVKVVTA